MLNESFEKAHQLVALGLLARIFYASEPLGESHRFNSIRLQYSTLFRVVPLKYDKYSIPACGARQFIFE